MGAGKAGGLAYIHWVPSHLGVQGNHEADALAKVGCQLHPDNAQSLPKRPRVEPMWDELGLEEMSLTKGKEASDSGASSSECSESPLVTVSQGRMVGKCASCVVLPPGGVLETCCCRDSMGRNTFLCPS